MGKYSPMTLVVIIGDNCLPCANVIFAETQCTMEGTKRSNIHRGIRVRIVLKQDQRTGKLTEGVVKDILTNSSFHPHGIKVRLDDGQVGRVKEIIEEEET